MKLADLRKLTIRKRMRIRFTLSNGLECVLNEQGVAQVPGLRSVPDFNLEDELERVLQFHLDVPSTDAKKAPRPQTVSREQVSAMVAAGGPEAVHHDEHDE